MTTTLLKLRQGDSGTLLDLNSSGSTGFRLDENGWNPAVATPVHMGDPPPVLERLDLLLSNTNYNNLAGNMQSLHEMQVLADRYINDPSQEDPVWLHAKMDGETGERRALVRSITVQYKAPWFGAGQSTTNIPLVLTVVRGPYWENTVVRSLPDVVRSSVALAEYDYTSGISHDIVGDVGARIRFFQLLNNNEEFLNYWMGIRSAGKHGITGISAFEPIWELEDGTNYTDVADVVDATASGGDIIRVTESAVDWDDGNFHNVSFIDITDLSTTGQNQFGKFLWLMRADVTTGTWEVRLTFTDGNYFQHSIVKDIVEIGGTGFSGWQYYEMGISPIPLYSPQVITNADYTKSYINDFGVLIEARRTSGSDTLDIDCYCLIPIDEGFCKLTTLGGALNITEMFGQSPSGLVQMVRRDNTNKLIGRGIIESINNFTLPPGDGRIYCVYTANPSVIADSLTFNDGNTGKYYERWLSLRGSE